jgi:hypothetical protein
MSHLTGAPNEKGRVVLINMTEKIEEMDTTFNNLCVKYNSKNLIRRSGLPNNPVREDEDLAKVYSATSSDSGTKRYMSRLKWDFFAVDYCWSQIRLQIQLLCGVNQAE